MPATLAEWISTVGQFVILATLIKLRRAEFRKYQAMNERMNGFADREIKMRKRIINLESQQN